jgi:hypothetical protein
MSTPNKYVPGFRLLNELQHKRTYLNTSGVAYERGDAVILTSGYLALATTLQLGADPKFVGIANTKSTAAENSSSGLLSTEVIPALSQYSFIVPEEDNLLVFGTDVGETVDLQSEDGIDNSDQVTLGLGFFIDAVDVSSAAVAANTFGYAIGHFEFAAAS